MAEHYGGGCQSVLAVPPVLPPVPLMADMEDILDAEGANLRESLSVEQEGPGQVAVYFRPEPRVGSVAKRKPSTRVKIMEVDVLEGLLTVFPMNNLDIPLREVKPKYSQVERVTFVGGTVVYSPLIDGSGEERPGRFLGSYHGRTEKKPVGVEVSSPRLEETVPRSAEDVVELLAGLPSYCVRNPLYGLGLRKRFRAIVRAVEQLTDALEIRVSATGECGYEEDSRTFTIPAGEMQKMVREIERVDRTSRNAANMVNGTSTYNAVASALGLPMRAMRYGRSELRKTLTAVANDEKPLSAVEQSELVETLARNAPSILERKPETIEGLESGIARAKAVNLREQLRSMMRQVRNENAWQGFMQRNPFILSLVFGRPIVKVGDQASVGGRTITGGGHKIADFLVRNSLTNNAALVEIKTPRAKLLNKTPYRNNVYAPAAELVGAINQVLDQKSKFEQEIAGIRDRNRSLDLEAHHVHACVLAGTMPTDEDHVRCFELFRHNLKDVMVVTYDELERKVEDLCGFLEGRTEVGEKAVEAQGEEREADDEPTKADGDEDVEIPF